MAIVRLQSGALHLPSYRRTARASEISRTFLYRTWGIGTATGPTRPGDTDEAMQVRPERGNREVALEPDAAVVAVVGSGASDRLKETAVFVPGGIDT